MLCVMCCVWCGNSNIFAAGIYNALAIPFAAGAFYPFLHWQLPPQFAGLAMMLSSVSVVCSSLLLFCHKPTALK